MHVEVMIQRKDMFLTCFVVVFVTEWWSTPIRRKQGQVVCTIDKEEWREIMKMSPLGHWIEQHGCGLSACPVFPWALRTLGFQNMTKISFWKDFFCLVTIFFRARGDKMVAKKWTLLGRRWWSFVRCRSCKSFCADNWQDTMTFCSIIGFLKTHQHHK